MMSSYMRTDSGFNGIQSIDKIQIGYGPDGTPVAAGNAPEDLGGTFALDDVSFDFDPVPEPSSALLWAMGSLALLRRRRG